MSDYTELIRTGEMSPHDRAVKPANGPPPEQATDLIRLLHDGGEGNVGLGPDTTQVKLHGGDQVAEVLPGVLRKHETKQTIGVYVTCCRFRGDRRKADKAIATRVIWADVDRKRAEAPQTHGEILERCDKVDLPRPSLIVASGNGHHVYWILREDPSLANPEDRARHSARVKRVGELLDGDAVSDVSRFLRVPGTFNRKDPACPKPVEIVFRDDSARYLPDEFPVAETEEEPDAEGPVFKIELPECVEQNAKLMAVLSARSDSDDHSRVDLRIAVALREVGIEEKEAASALAWSRSQLSGRAGKKARRKDYIQRTIAKASGIVENDVPEEVVEFDERHFGTLVDGKFLIARPRTPEEAALAGSPLVWSRVTDLQQHTRNVLVPGKTPTGKAKKVPLVSGWLAWPGRSDYPGGVVFAPSPMSCPKGAYNLFSGFAATPDASGSCERLKSHLREVVCGGNAEAFAWLWNWLAHLVQFPGARPGTAVCLRSSEEGTGKSIVFEHYIGPMLGLQYCHTLPDSGALMSQFNGWQRGNLLCLVEEAVWAGGNQQKAKLKNLVTATRLPIDEKFVPSVMAPVFSRVVMLSNEAHFVPAGAYNRRYFVLEVADTHRRHAGLDPAEDARRAAYWSELASEADHGGRERLLYELMQYEVDHDLVRIAPRTDASTAQIAASLHPVEQALLGLLETGEWGADRLGLDRTAQVDQVLRENRGLDRRPVEMKLSGLLRKLGCENKRTGKGGERVQWSYLSPLDEARKLFERHVLDGAAYPWPDPEPEEPNAVRF